jgi:hypothetical protein
MGGVAGERAKGPGEIFSGVIYCAIVARAFVTKDFSVSPFLGNTVEILESFSC